MSTGWELLLEWKVPDTHPALPGHFPGHPIVPGVVLLDRVMALAMAVTGAAGDTCPAQGWQVSQAKFLSPVGPGETLHFKLVCQPAGQIRFTISGPGRDVACGSLTPS